MLTMMPTEAVWGWQSGQSVQSTQETAPVAISTAFPAFPPMPCPLSASGAPLNQLKPDLHPHPHPFFSLPFFLTFPCTLMPFLPQSLLMAPRLHTRLPRLTDILQHLGTAIRAQTSSPSPPQV